MTAARKFILVEVGPHEDHIEVGEQIADWLAYAGVTREVLIAHRPENVGRLAEVMGDDHLADWQDDE